MSFRKNWLASFALLALTLGCGGKSDQPKSATVKGKVTLDGAALAAGKISFDEGPGVPSVELEIKDGAYSGPVTVGKKTVRITVMRMAPAPKGMPGVEENVLPAKYNTESKEVREVKDSGPNEFDFDVKKK